MMRNIGWAREACRAAGSCRATNIKTLLGVTLLPAPHHRPAHADPLGDFQHRQPVGREQHDLSPLDVLQRPTTVLDDPMKPDAIAGGEQKRNSLSHPARLARP